MNSRVAAVCTSYDSSELDGRVRGPDSVDKSRHLLGQGGIRDLEDVLRVLLAGVGEVEAPDEDDVVGHGHLGVHVVMDGPWEVGSRALPRKGGSRQHGTEQRLLPAGVPV